MKKDTETVTYIQVYDPYPDKDKEAFFDEVSDVINTTKETDMLIIMNGHLGSQRSPWEEYLGPHSAPNSTRNFNGQLILELYVPSPA